MAKRVNKKRLEALSLESHKEDLNSDPFIFVWRRGEEEIARIRLYKNGFIEFFSDQFTRGFAVNCIGTKDESIAIDGIRINPNT